MHLLLCLAAVSEPAGPWLPPSDPLSPWLRSVEEAGGALVPGEYPFAVPEGADPPLPGGMLGRIGSISSPERSILLPGGGSMGLSLVLAGELDDSTGLESRTGIAVEAVAAPGGGFTLRERLSVWMSSDERQPGGFPQFHEGVEKGRHLYVDWGWAAWESGGLEISLGRIPLLWGPGRFTSLLVSDNSPPLDMLKIDWEIAGPVSFSGFTATVQSESASYLTAHRLDVVPAPWLRAGISEAVFFVSEGLDLAYMNPLIPWYPVQWNERGDDNAFLVFDATVLPVGGAALYGELLMDDLQYETQWDRPNKFAWTVGASASAGASRATLEYTRIDRYVYSQKWPRNYYLHGGRIIGSGLGPDCDRVTLELSCAALWPVTAGITADHERHGEGTVYEGYPDSVETGGPFPSGIVEHSTRLGLDVSWYPTGWLEAHCGAGRTWTRNSDHVQGAGDAITEARLELLARFGL
jgi:hypothetical protein